MTYLIVFTVIIKLTCSQTSWHIWLSFEWLQHTAPSEKRKHDVSLTAKLSQDYATWLFSRFFFLFSDFEIGPPDIYHKLVSKLLILLTQPPKRWYHRQYLRHVLSHLLSLLILTGSSKSIYYNWDAKFGDMVLALEN